MGCCLLASVGVTPDSVRPMFCPLQKKKKKEKKEKKKKADSDDSD
jgi:hypothetical protein